MNLLFFTLVNLLLDFYVIGYLICLWTLYMSMYINNKFKINLFIFINFRWFLNFFSMTIEGMYSFTCNKTRVELNVNIVIQIRNISCCVVMKIACYKCNICIYLYFVYICKTFPGENFVNWNKSFINLLIKNVLVSLKIWIYGWKITISRNDKRKIF